MVFYQFFAETLRLISACWLPALIPSAFFLPYSLFPTIYGIIYEIDKTLVPNL